MKITTKIASLALLASLATAAVSPMAIADGTQGDKNNMRNLGIGGAAVLGYGLLKHNTAATVIGAAAGGYGAYKYEQDRHRQSQAQSYRNHRYYSRHHHYYHHHS